MAKKSNKTEHVLKLITKSDDDVQDDLFQLPQELAEIGSVPAPSSKSKYDKNKTEIVSEDNEADGTTIKYKTKLEIDIKPELNIKQKKPQESEKAEAPAVQKLEPEREKVQNAEPEQLPELNEPDREGSASLEQHDHLINLAEILVKEKIGLVMEKMKVCSCKTCVNDVLALTLNLLPTKYVTIDKGRQLVQLESYKKQYETDILAALTKACVRVKASPRHERMR